METLVRICSELSRWLLRWPVALGLCVVLGLAVLVPGLGQPGLWEPQERLASDRLAPPADVVKPETPDPPPPKDGCVRIPPSDAAARTLTGRALEWGRDNISDDDFGRRVPLALLALLALLATAGIAMRAAGPRAGIVAAIVLLAMPLFVMQGRLVTSDIGTACGAALTIYGLYALARPVRTRSIPLRIADLLVGVAAFASGLLVGFYGGGALLGVVVPVGAFAAAGAFGVPIVLAVSRREPILPHLPALIATLIAAATLALLTLHLYELKDPYPGIVPPARQMFGRAIVAEGCWSWALGATWHPEDDLRFIFDSTFEQIGYGTFPWGVLAPVAMFALLRDRTPNRRFVGALALAWAGAAWIATEAFQRKVGFAIWTGFPALAVAVGVWIDTLLSRRRAAAVAKSQRPVVANDAPHLPPLPEPDPDEVDDEVAVKSTGISIAGAMLVGLFFFFAVFDLAKDLQTFPEKLTSLLSGSDIVAYPKDAKIGLELKRWVVAFGALAGFGFAFALGVWRPGKTRAAKLMQRSAAIAMAVALGTSIVLAGFWSFVWQPRLAIALSTKEMFEIYAERRASGDKLVIMGDLGQAPKMYAPDTQPELAPSRADVVKALKRPERVFAIAPRSELCALHRELGESPYYVLEQRNLKHLLFSNKLEPGARNENPLAHAILHKEPTTIQYRPKGKVVWGNSIQLIGWNMPASVQRGDTFWVTIYYKILQQVSGNWKTIMHFDGAARFSGDHEPIDNICPTSTWTKGDYIVDRVQVVAGGSTFSPGRYELWTGFFTGSAPNFRNMTLTEAPGDIRDTTDRVKIAPIMLESGGGCCSASGEHAGSIAIGLGVLLMVLRRRKQPRSASRIDARLETGL